MIRKLIIVCVGCLLLMGCQQGLAETSASDTLASAATVENITDRTAVEETTGAVVPMPGTLEWGNPLISTEDHGMLPGTPLTIYAQDKVRITYTHNQNYVQYITSTAGLDRYGVDALKKYDEAFFEKKALVLICETATSGSVRLSVDQILQQDSQMTVVLSRELPGDVGTADMATWLIWVEVDAGWDAYSWILHNPMLESEMTTH